MTNRGRFLLLFCALAAAAALTGCSDNPTVAGAGSETTNGIMVVGRVRNGDGTPANNTVVSMFPSQHDGAADTGSKDFSSDTTDSSGAFRFCRVDSGTFTIIARNAAAATSAMLSGLRVEKGDSIKNAEIQNLQKTGSITFDFSRDTDTSAAYLFIPGTDIFAPVSASGAVTLDDVPAGAIPEVSCRAKNGSLYGLRYGMTVKPEDRIVVRNPSWKHSRGIVLNTSGGGAGVTGDVCDFPVLIRLTGSNFNFSEAQPMGGDIRFSRMDRPFLPYEIESWNASDQRAEIWVKVDTVRGGSADQSIVMYWGNPQAASMSGAAAVFDTAAGFAGIWHLSEPSSDSARDATINRYNGVSPDTARTSVAEGIIGNCRQFDGTTSCIIMPNTAGGKLNFPQNGTYTISAWVYVDSLDSGSHVVISKGAFQYYLWFTYIYQNAPNWEFVEYEDNGGGWKCPTHPVEAQKWVLLTGVCNGTSQYLYVNGELADTAIVSYTYTEPRNTTTEFIVGRYTTKAGYPPGKLGGYCWFDGKIDEVRACGKSRGADWIRLCYMNQRTDDRLVSFAEQ
jgi:hypothetical protein